MNTISFHKKGTVRRLGERLKAALFTAILLAGLASYSHTQAQEQVVISEFMAKNTVGIADEDGTRQDWIELYNGGLEPVNLENWSLTDSATLLTKWRFPATNLAPGGFLVVWASDKNRRMPGAPLHTNFKLADEGEYLGLVQPDGMTVSSQFYPRFPAQYPDVSYGLVANAETNYYLSNPTPGFPNSSATNFVVSRLNISPLSGWFSNAISVTITTATAGATIYFTTNGTIPTPSNGVVYTQPLQVSGTTVIRAAAYRAGFVSPSPQSRSYIYLDQVLHQTGEGFPTNWGAYPASYSLATNIVENAAWQAGLYAGFSSIPSISIAMDPRDMFGTNGIYSNPLEEGDLWERACSVEFIGRSVSEGFQINCGIRMQGELSRDPEFTSKHNFRLLFKQIYGAGRLLFPLYADSKVHEFDNLVLHASFNDHWFWSGALAQMHRDQWCSDIQREIGGYGTHGKYVHLYINGLYWGLYNIGERPDASYAAHYLGGEKSDYDAFNSGELVDGTTNDWNAMLAIANAGITNDMAYTNLAHYLNIPAFVDYMLINFYAGNLDWPIHNWRAAGSLQNNVPFRFFSWDAEATLGLDSWLGIDRTGVSDGLLGQLYQSLKAYPEFRRIFGDRAQTLLFNGGALTPERAMATWLKRSAEIRQSIVPESARWGKLSPLWDRVYDYNDWNAQGTFLLTNWFPQRTSILLGQLRNAGLYPTIDAPSLIPDRGIVSNTVSVAMSAPGGVVYYTLDGTDPRLPDGSIAPGAQLYQSPVTVTDTTHIKARALSDTTWSALVTGEFVSSHESPRLTGILYLPDHSIQLQSTALAGVPYTVLASTDLVNWSSITNMPADASSSFLISHPNIQTNTYHFFRIRWP